MMRLGFYYHVPAQLDEATGRIRTYGYLGCFLDSLMPYLDELVFFAHPPRENETLDYTLDARIRLCPLGPKKNAFFRLMTGRRLLTRFRREISGCDLMLVRAPTPLFAAWDAVTRQCGVRIAPLIVGDYEAGNANLPFRFPKKQVVAWLNRHITREEYRILRRLPGVFTNSHELYGKFAEMGCRVKEIRTTTLSEESFSSRTPRDIRRSVKLVYAGRFDWNKGLRELVDALIELNRDGRIDAHLLMIGWEITPGTPVETALRETLRANGMEDRIHFLGKRRVGKDLLDAYCQGDVFVLPSYAEGFPRVIWEAMAARLPVIATAVGSIPHMLEHGKNAWLIPPRDVSAIVQAVLGLCRNGELYHSLIAGGEETARGNTLDVQARKLITEMTSDES